MEYTKEDFRLKKEYLEQLKKDTGLNDIEQGFLNAMKAYENLILFGVGCSVPVLNRCECLEPEEEPIKICTNCNGYVE